MNEYNERTLKNVLEDYREEKDAEYLREIEEAANDPRFQIKEGEAEAFAKKYSKKTKNRTRKILLRVASILLVIAIGISVIPINVEGRKSTIAQLIVNYVSSEFIAVDSEDILLTYEGEYVPTWIPNGYEVEPITNGDNKNQIMFTNENGNTIAYREQVTNIKSKIDSEEYESVENININGFGGIYAKKDEMIYVILSTENVILCISTDDTELDIIGFAELIEKR